MNQTSIADPSIYKFTDNPTSVSALPGLVGQKDFKDIVQCSDGSKVNRIHGARGRVILKEIHQDRREIVLETFFGVALMESEGNVSQIGDILGFEPLACLLLPIGARVNVADSPKRVLLWVV